MAEPEIAEGDYEGLARKMNEIHNTVAKRHYAGLQSLTWEAASESWRESLIEQAKFVVAWARREQS